MADSVQGKKIKVNPPSNIYTVLVIVATLFMIFGTVFLWMRCMDYFGTWLPVGP